MKNSTPSIRFYWRASKRKGGGAIRAYLTYGKERTYGGVTGCYCTKEEWAQLNPDGSLRNPETASDVLKALSQMLCDLRLMALAEEMRKEMDDIDCMYPFQLTMRDVLISYIKKNVPRKNNISAIVDRIMIDDQEGGEE